MRLSKINKGGVDSPLLVLYDLDNVLGLTAQAIIDWSNTWVNHSTLGIPELTIEHYRESFPEMWGVNFADGNARWTEFCKEHMDAVPPDAEMQRSLATLPEGIIGAILTSRSQSTKTVTRQWVDLHYPVIKPVLHALMDWSNDPLAHEKTKVNSLETYVDNGSLVMPDIAIDDEPKHARGYRDMGIAHTILYGRYPWNEHARQDENIVWLPTSGLLVEYILGVADTKRQAG